MSIFKPNENVNLSPNGTFSPQKFNYTASIATTAACLKQAISFELFIKPVAKTAIQELIREPFPVVFMSKVSPATDRLTFLSKTAKKS